MIPRTTLTPSPYDSTYIYQGRDALFAHVTFWVRGTVTLPVRDTKWYCTSYTPLEYGFFKKKPDERKDCTYLKVGD